MFHYSGGRGIDTALTYSDPINEQIAEALKEYASISDEIFLTTKVPCCPGTGFCKQGEYNGTIAEDIKKNNALLGVDVTDLTLLHHPCDTPAHTIERWLELEAGLASGLTKAIGVSNFNSELLAQIAADPRTKVTPAANQCNHAIGHHNQSFERSGSDDKTVQYCKEHGISYSAYSPLEGLSGKDVFDFPQVKAIASTHNVSGAQVALKWLVQQNITMVTAAHNPAYISEDINLWAFELTDQEMSTLAAI
jgi:diketogulonate reductase-like aldo/keto reductase